MSGETFGEALRRWRGDHTVREVAALAKIGKTYVSDLERDRHQPGPVVAAALDQALGAGGELMAAADVRPGASPLERADALQVGVHEALASGPMTDATLDEWDYTVARHGRATRYRAEADLLNDLLANFQDLRILLARRHPPEARKRLHVAAARMSGLMALTLLKLGDDRAQGWWRTGRAAAAAADDRATLSWIYAHEAYQQYYNGDLPGAIDLAVRSQQLAGGLPCVGPALAAPLEARAYALLGSGDKTRTALESAEAALGRLPEEDRIGSAFGYSQSQLHFHAGNACTHLGETQRAREELAQAAELYPADDLTDRALIHLDEAMCLAVEGDPAAAAVQAMHTIVAMPVQHRSALIRSRAREIAVKVHGAQGTAEVQALREVLALPEGLERGGDEDRDSNDGGLQGSVPDAR
ncbi:helix-turn-helix domain-containing protein [Streptomyces sp. NPDC013161]|uniref:helix-turn-helix domain-containing protein n=1 Tax=Streptomyces sp. NPDC013161 TaxID=3364862 RepID=UPI0036A72AC2